jgi:hypothetical protein
MLAAVPAAAQVSELGLTGGVTYYVGDINPYAHWPVNSHLGAGLMYRYNFDERYAVRVQGLYSKLEAWDRNADDALQLQRNLGFRTVLLEASALLEVNFFPYRGLDKNSRTWTPFLFAGLGYFHTDPETLLDDTWYHLQPLGTEGQGRQRGIRLEPAVPSLRGGPEAGPHPKAGPAAGMGLPPHLHGPITSMM